MNKIGYIRLGKRFRNDDVIKKFTHILICFIEFDKNGDIMNSKMFADDSQYISHVRNVCRDNNIRFGVSIGGYTGSKYMEIAYNNSYDIMISNVRNFVKEYDFDYVDIDHEFPKCISKYRRFVEDIKGIEGLNCVSIYINIHPKFLINLSLKGNRRVLEVVDFINIGAYDNVFEKNHSSLNFAMINVGIFRKHYGVPYNKMILCIPLYARSCSFLKVGKSIGIQSIPLEHILVGDEYIDGRKYYFNGTKTIGLKKRMVINKGMLGVAYWECSSITEELMVYI